jgi:hypothetical protein
MTNEQALKMAKAKLECIERETSGKAELCNNDCESCSLCYEQGNMGEQKEWLKMAIKALEQQPCEDAISRQEVLSCYQAMRDMCDGETKDVVLVDNIKMLPSVQPKAKVGHWIKVVESYLPYICSECDKPEFRKSNYCPSCGAEMQEVEK